MSQSYGGSYIDDGYLNIMLTGNQEECNKIIFDVFVYDNPCTKIVKYSYKQIMEEKDKIENAMANCSSKDNFENKDTELQSLMDSVKMVAYDDMNNSIVVSLTDNADDVSITVHSDSPTKIIESSNIEEQIDTFKKEISDSEIITFEVTDDEAEAVATNWRPGRGHIC